MNKLKLVREAIETLTINKLRTALAMLGIIIGIGSVIALVSLGQASQQAIQSQIQSLGANLLTISPGSQNTGAVRGAAGGGKPLPMMMQLPLFLQDKHQMLPKSRHNIVVGDRLLREQRI